MPPGSRVSKRVKKNDIVEISDAEQPSTAPDPAASRSPTKSTPAKRKTRKSSAAVVQDGDSSPDVPLSRQIKKPRIATPLPSPRVAVSPIALESEDDEQSVVVESPAPAPKQSRKLPEKVTYMAGKEASPATEEPTKDGSSTRRSKLKGKGRALAPVHSAELEDNDSDGATGGVEQHPQLTKSPLKSVKQESASEDELPFTPMGSTRRAKPMPDVESPSPSKPVHRAPPSLKKRAAKASRSRSEMLYPAEFHVPADSDYDDQEDFEPIDTDLMPLVFQDMKLRLDYVTVPPLVYAEMHSTNQNGNNHQLELYSPVWAALNTEDDPLCRRRFRNAVRFQSSLPYINPARASTDLATRDGDRLVLSGPGNRRQNAVFLTTGVVNECQLITPGYFGTSSSYLARRITIYPLHTEHQRTAAFIGNLLNHETYLSTLYNGIMSFATRSGNGGATSSPSTPTRRGCPVLKLRQQASTIYPGSRGFNETVPVYDARGKSDWMFTTANMAQLAQLPLYKGGASDPPADSVVTVGYAVNEYPCTNAAYHGSPVASLNVLFVIIIGDLDRTLLDNLSMRMAPSA
ncbi:hypothetical protein F5887DRAFT_1086609 [Amanita rubescens]|nr:hypothetical protein F5887DRAFT_1086609 [Amanita rubescens]